jgi:hypothetical protein
LVDALLGVLFFLELNHKLHGVRHFVYNIIIAGLIQTGTEENFQPN